MVNSGHITMNADSKALPFLDQVAIMAAAVNSINHPMVSLNDEGIIQWSNQAFQNLVGQSDADLVNQRFHQVMPLQLEGRLVLFAGKSALSSDIKDQLSARNIEIIDINNFDELILNTLFLYLKNHQESVLFSINHHCHVLSDQHTIAHLLIMQPINANDEQHITKSHLGRPRLNQHLHSFPISLPRENPLVHSTKININQNSSHNLTHIINRYQRHHHDLISDNQQLRSIIANIPMIILVIDQDGTLVLCEGKDLAKINLKPDYLGTSPTSSSGLRSEELIGHSIFDICADEPVIIDSIRRCLTGEYHALSHYWHDSYFEIEYIPFINFQGENHGALMICTDVTEQFQYAESARLQNWRSVIFSNIAVKIHQSLDMNEILQTTVREIRNFLRTDRVLIYQFNHDWSGNVVVESVADSWSSTLGLNIVDTCFVQGMWQEYQNGKYIAIDDIYSSHLSPCHRGLLESLQVRSNLVVPIIENERLWGLLIAHHCSEKRHWKKIELELLIQLATQLSIALYQAHLLNQEMTQRKLLAQQNIELELARREAETATTMKSTFLAMMSHEIRTPMNAVLGMTGLLMDTNLNAEQLDFVNTIRFSGETLLSIINEILDFSKLEAQEMELEILDFNLISCIEDCTDLLANAAYNQGISLYSWIDVNLPCELRGDASRLKQVMINLINNAIKFTSEGEVMIKASLVKEYNDQVLIRISVKDTGIGIPEAKLSTLFKPFTQVDASTTRKYGGTGLGLAISQQLVDLMDGQIGVVSELDKGSEFWLEVPFTKCNTSTVEYDRSLNLSVLINCRILVIDHHHTNCKLIDYQLSSYQMWVDTCTDLVSGYDLLVNACISGSPYQIIILDMETVAMDEKSLLQYIKAQSELKNTHLVMLTSWQKRGMTQKYRELGFTACLNKPIKQSLLAECLVNVMTLGYYNPDSKSHHLYQQQNHFYAMINESDIGKSSKLKILLVEDSLINQKVITNQLRNLGYTADVSGNGKEALELLNQIPYDMVLMDCQMPELDGYDTTRAIRQLKAPQCNVIIIAMTANAMKEDRQRCLDSGMNDYLSKPIRKELLQEKISTWEKYIYGSTMLYSAAPSHKVLSQGILEPPPNYLSQNSSQIPVTRSGHSRTSHNASVNMTISDSLSPNLSNDSHNFPEVASQENTATNGSNLANPFTDLGMVTVDQLNREMPLIDWQYLHSISGDDSEFERDLLQTFIAGVPDILDHLTLGMASRNFPQITAQAHLLKGSAASTGIQFIAQLAAIIENVGKRIHAYQKGAPNNMTPDWESQVTIYFQLTNDYIAVIQQQLVQLTQAISE